MEREARKNGLKSIMIIVVLKNKNQSFSLFSFYIKIYLFL